jgi:hypothetical protein
VIGAVFIRTPIVIFIVIVLIVGSELRVERLAIDLFKVLDNLVA